MQIILLNIWDLACAFEKYSVADGWNVLYAVRLIYFKVLSKLLQSLTVIELAFISVSVLATYILSSWKIDTIIVQWPSLSL